MTWKVVIFYFEATHNLICYCYNLYVYNYNVIPLCLESLTINMYYYYFTYILINANAVFPGEGVVLHNTHLRETPICDVLCIVYDVLYMKTVLFVFVSLLETLRHKFNIIP